MNFQEFTDNFLQWSEEKVESKKSDGFTVCPFARRARLKDKIQFIDARENIQDQLLTFDREQKEIGIAWLGDVSAHVISDVEVIIDQLKQENPDLLYFTSTRQSGHFVKNFTDCVFIQLRQDIMEKRNYLKTTKYYDSWPLDYYNMITNC